MELNTDNPYVSILRNFIALELKKFEEDVSKILIKNLRSD